MSNEIYLNHPTFGLLYRICLLDDNQELFTTLYAQRLFFLVTSTSEGVIFEPISRSDSRLLVENRLRKLLRVGASGEYKQLQAIHQQTFQ
jgi:PII interaction protein X